jgi:hypothetical protein
LVNAPLQNRRLTTSQSPLETPKVNSRSGRALVSKR